LSDVDALLGGLDRLIGKKRDLKQAAMQQLLTGQSRLPGFPGEWEEGFVQDVILGYFCGPSPTCEERNIDDDIEWGVLKTTAVTKENGWNWKAHKVLPKAFWNKPNLELKKGTVVVTKAGPRHRVDVPELHGHAVSSRYGLARGAPRRRLPPQLGSTSRGTQPTFARLPTCSRAGSRL
jgi:hypothetical protein